MTAEQILSALNTLFSPGQTVELRALGDRTHFGYYTDFSKLAEDAEMLDRVQELKGIYITLNEVNPALLARCVNRVKKAGNKEPQTGDSDIIRRRWFPIDIDAKRPAGISSNDEEHKATLRRAEQIAGFLSELGWPKPVMGDSGNGAHLLYRIDLKSDEESTKLIKTCLAGLDQIFSDTRSDVDTSVYNASRIWKLYGTTARKGDNTKERPYRKSCILSVPDEIQTVPVSELIHLSTLYQEPDSSKSRNLPTGGIGSTGGIDLSEWLLSHGLTYNEKPYSGGRLFVFDQCPFSSAHKDGAYAIQFDNGAIFAGCHHNSCGGGTQRWSELRERFEDKRPSRLTEEEYAEKRKQNARDRALKIRERDGGYEHPNSQEILYSLNTEHIPLEATSILKNGDPFDYILKTFFLDHEGDETLAKCLIMSFASRSVINSKGLHVLTTGISGKGKSHGYETMLELIPQEFRLSGRLSDKSLFYSADLKPRAVICLDDNSLSEQMQEILKGVTSSFRQPLVYRTVNKDRKGENRIIPERCVWWVAKMEGTGDDQVWNRMLTVWVDESREQDDRVLVRELDSATLPPQPEIIRHEIQVCQQMWRLLSDQWVIIPYANDIRFSSSENRRNPGMLLDIVRAHAVLVQYQREHQEYNGTSCIVATTEDFKVASHLFQKLNGEDGGQMSKLTRGESDLVSALRDCGKTEIKISDMQGMIGKSHSVIFKMLHGYNSYGNHYSGLLEKCPAISYLDRTDVSDNGDTSKRNRVYTWNADLYYSWAGGGGCWLDGHGSDDDGDDFPSGGKTKLLAGNPATTTNYESVAVQSLTQDEDKAKNIDLTSCGLSRLNENVATVSDSNNTNNNQNNFLGTELRRENETSPEALKDNQDCIHFSRLPASTYFRPPLGPSPTPVSESGQINSGGYFRHVPPLPHDTGAYHRLKIEDIDPGKFHKIDKVGKGPCDVCGKRWISYIERDYPGKRPDSYTHKVCDRCMSKAVTREIMSVRTLPGTVNIQGLSHVNKSIGRCDICGMSHASWSGNGIKLCDTCYSREKRTGEKAEV